MLKKLCSCIREYKTATILTPVFVSLEVILECLIPLFMSELIDYIDPSVDVLNRDLLLLPSVASSTDTLATVAIYGGILIAMALCSLLCGALSGRFCAKASAGFAKNLRYDMFSNIQKFSFANIDKFSTSGLVTRLTTDIQFVQMSFMMIIRMAVRCPFMLIFAFTMSFMMNVKLACIFLVVLPILTVGLYFILIKARPQFDLLFKRYDALNDSVEENVRGIRVVKAYDRVEFEKRKFGKASDRLQNTAIKAERILVLNSPLLQFSIYVVMLLLIVLGSLLITSQTEVTLTTGELSSMMTYAMQMLMSLMMCSVVFVMITMSLSSSKRIVEVLDEKSTVTNPENPVTVVENGAIDFENVNFKYSEKAERFALADINLHIESGETVGIIGGTGSSKTTLVQLISRLYDTTEGTVSVGGKNVKAYDLETIRNQVAVVLQKNVLFSGTIAENLRWGNPDATDEELAYACRLAQADGFVSAFPDGYNTHIEQGGTNVSGGQKQRLCIARALLKKPKILILDDSTSAVDTKTDALIRKAFREEIPDTTKIIIAQRIASVMDADKIIIMDNGKINDIGTHEQLLARNKIYQEVYHSQNKEVQNA